MEPFHRPQILRTRDLKFPNYYTQALDGDYRDFAFNEERVLEYKSLWRSKIFQVPENTPIDLEIGTGNGVHFQHHCVSHPERCIIGVELKYKPLIQSVRGMLRRGAKNGRMVRFHAFNIDQIFAEEEINQIYVHFPDPWTTPRKLKNRIMNQRMLNIFWRIQKPGSFIDFKTDSLEMFLWAMEQMNEFTSKYKVEYQTLDLHNSPMATENVMTSFEKIFARQGIKINFVRLCRI